MGGAELRKVKGVVVKKVPKTICFFLNRCSGLNI